MTLSFNLAPGISLSQAVDAISALHSQLQVPPSLLGAFEGTAQAFQSSLRSTSVLVLAAIMVVYVVLGMLYESVVHPITILSALPSAGVGALVMLMVFHYDLNLIAFIGIILLIGIVKKNAIMMIDFALEAERREGAGPLEAIHQACLLRFRPIMMTTMCALCAGLPLALGYGAGSEVRRPLGVAIVGGLLVSQFLTLYTTPGRVPLPRSTGPLGETACAIRIARTPRCGLTYVTAGQAAPTRSAGRSGSFPFISRIGRRPLSDYRLMTRPACVCDEDESSVPASIITTTPTTTFTPIAVVL